MKKILFMMIALAVLTGFRMANNRSITGTVIDATDGLPLAGVSVKIAGTSIGTQTDPKGRYSISVPDGSAELEFAFIGYTKQVIKLGNSSTVNVVLKADTRSLNEVVVTAYGIQKKKSITGSVATVNGRTAGLMVSGAPVAASAMYIRGNNKIMDTMLRNRKIPKAIRVLKKTVLPTSRKARFQLLLPMLMRHHTATCAGL